MMIKVLASPWRFEMLFFCHRAITGEVGVGQLEHAVAFQGDFQFGSQESDQLLMVQKSCRTSGICIKHRGNNLG